MSSPPWSQRNRPPPPGAPQSNTNNVDFRPTAAHGVQSNRFAALSEDHVHQPQYSNHVAPPQVNPQASSYNANRGPAVSVVQSDDHRNRMQQPSYGGGHQNGQARWDAPYGGRSGYNSNQGGSQQHHQHHRPRPPPHHNTNNHGGPPAGGRYQEQRTTPGHYYPGSNTSSTSMPSSSHNASSSMTSTTPHNQQHQRQGGYGGGSQHQGDRDRLLRESEAELQRFIRLEKPAGVRRMESSEVLKALGPESKILTVYLSYPWESPMQHAARVTFLDWYLSAHGYGMNKPSQIPQFKGSANSKQQPDEFHNRDWTEATEEEVNHLRMIGSLFFNIANLDNTYGGRNGEVVKDYLNAQEAK